MKAFVAASSTAAQDFGPVNQARLAFAKTAFERNGAATEVVFVAKNVGDAAELQADQARSSFENYMSETTKITEMTVKTVNKAFVPIGARVVGVAETFAENAS